MGKIKAFQTIRCEFQAQTTGIADEFVEYLNEQFASVEFELDELPNGYVATAGEEATGWYEPETRYEPSEYEIDFEIWQDDFRDVCYGFRDKYDDENIFCIDSCSCVIEGE